MRAIEDPAPTEVLSVPELTCTCGHPFAYHRGGHACGMGSCDCAAYVQAAIAAAPTSSGPDNGNLAKVAPLVAGADMPFDSVVPGDVGSSGPDSLPEPPRTVIKDVLATVLPADDISPSIPAPIAAALDELLPAALGLPPEPADRPEDNLLPNRTSVAVPRRLICKRCGHRWTPRSATKWPRACALCGSAYYDISPTMSHANQPSKELRAQIRERHREADDSRRKYNETKRMLNSVINYYDGPAVALALIFAKLPAERERLRKEWTACAIAPSVTQPPASIGLPPPPSIEAQR